MNSKLLQEAAIVERQRQLAAQLAANKAAKSSHSSSVTVSKAAPEVYETDQQRLLRLVKKAKAKKANHVTAHDQQKTSQTTKKATASKPTRVSNTSSSSTKMSSLFSLGAKVGSETKKIGAEMVVSGLKPEQGKSQTQSPASSSSFKRPSKRRSIVTDDSVSSSSVLKRPRIQKKKFFGNESLYQANNSSISPDDYWKSIRAWDFLADITVEVQQQKASSSKKSKRAPRKKSKKSDDSTGSDETVASKDKSKSKTITGAESDDDEEGELSESVPDSFASSVEYINIWAPLLIDEMKAQIMSDVLSKKRNNNINWGNVPQGWKTRVLCAPLMRDVGTTTDYVTIQLRVKKQPVNGEKNEFITNDIVMLAVPFEHQTRPNQTSQAGKQKVKRRCLLGHVEHSRKSADGLMIKVSRDLWLRAGCEEMYLMNMGSNVTAMREFTSLCRVNSIPILDELLAGNAKWSNAYKNRIIPSALRKKDAPKKFVSFSEELIVGPFCDSASTNRKEKKELITKIGGVEALGKGFVEYATKKFNTSQLEAISAAASDYGSGGFTLVKGPPGTGKTTTLVALLNSLHIKQYHQYHEKVRRIISRMRSGLSASAQNSALREATKCKPRMLVCAPSNAAVDNIILKIMEQGFVDGNGMRYNPSIIRVGSGQSEAVSDVGLEKKVKALMEEAKDKGKLQTSIAGLRYELERARTEIARCQRRVKAIESATPYQLPRHWEIRCDESTFDQSGRVYFVNHRDKATTFEIPPPPKPDEKKYNPSQMPEHRKYTNIILKQIEKFNSITSKVNLRELVMAADAKQQQHDVRQQVETNYLDAAHIVLTTLGTAGAKILEATNKFEVVVIDEAAQSVEPSTLSALELGSSHAILVGDPQQLPATIFSISGRKTKFDRSLFQRLEEAGHPVHMLNQQYRMNPAISAFPRTIFYNNTLLDGPNVQHPEYGASLRRRIFSTLSKFQALTVLDLDSSEQRSGTSLSNAAEARLALDLYITLNRVTAGALEKSSVAVITPYSQQTTILKRVFENENGPKNYSSKVEINTVDAFQGREADIVIFSCVRASGSKGVGFLSDVRRMNVALTRAKHFLFVICRCESVVVNPYWKQLVDHAKQINAVVKVPLNRQPGLIF